MRPMWKASVSYSTTPVAILKRWCKILRNQLCYTLGESNKKLQELFGKLSAMKAKGASEKLDQAAVVPGGLVPVDAGVEKGKRARGPSKKRTDT